MVTASATRSNLISDYISYANGRSDGPIKYKRYMAYALLGSVIADRSYLDLGYTTLYPNFYMMLVGPSGKVRKSTCINHMKEIATRVSNKILWSGNFSDEGLLEKLQKDRTGMIVEGEFAKMMAGLQKKFALQGRAILTDIYECPEVYPMPIRVKKEEELAEMIESPVLSIVSASTPEWLLEYTEPSDIVGGFLGRFLFIYAENREEERNRLAYDVSLREKLVKRLHKLREKDFELELRATGIPDPWKPGPMTISPEAKKLYYSWKEGVNHRIEESHELQGIHGVIDRISDCVWKFAIINATMDLTIVISREHIYQAIQMGNESIESAARFVYKMSIMNDKDLVIMEKIKNFISTQQNRTASFRDFQRRLHITKRTLENPIATLLASGELTKHQNGRTLEFRLQP